VEDLEHPSWCDQAHCTATAPRPGYRAGETGHHRSVPVRIDHVPNAGDVVFDSELNPLVAHLSRPAPPWDPVAFLNLGTVADPELLSLPAARARAALRQLEALLALAHDEPADGTDS
jgi:hypothetical protein